jgi:FlaA1/EpsC-like NDP-sugar epimerase/lipopolysaccharide/colanic/teichoic acid biosynthesis glycosyltransferase
MVLKNASRFTILTLGYSLVLQLAFVVALLLRFDGAVPAASWRGYLVIAPWFTGFSLVAFYFAGLYHGLWRYASTVTLFQIVKGCTLSVLSLVVMSLFGYEPPFPRSVVVLVWVWEIVLIGGVRFAWRLSLEHVLGLVPPEAGRAVVVGAGHAGVHLINEMRRGPAGHEVLQPVGFVDDDPRLPGHMIEGVRVLGTIADLPRAIKEQQVEMVIISDPDLPASVVREIARFCADAHVRVKMLSGLSDVQLGRSVLSQMRDVSIEDLLGRQPVHLQLTEMAEFLRGQCVLVTGAGGSIGAELARQVTNFGPACLILLDHAENGLYYIHRELVAQYPALPMHALVTDIQDAEAIEQVFAKFRPTVVFHAAAHKHVPLLETNPREAVLNNVTGTRNLLDTTERHGVSKFVLISTDKAVNPTSVMGATKRVCEMLMQSRSLRSQTRFVAVRFGNVLGSEGSVVPLFQRQIQRGGPLTVTHPEARRFFMTIPEAVRLVLQAGSMGRGGEVFLLDMGEQVRIDDLARQLIRMVGLRPGEDIEIVYTGLRPGEKLCEEVQSDAERMRMTQHERIMVWDLDAPPESELLGEVDELETRARAGDAAGVRLQLQRIVPEYRDPPPESLAVSREDADLVELPGVALPGSGSEPPRVAGWMRQSLDSLVALGFVMLTAPLWGLIWLEARGVGERDPFRRFECVGRSRRRQHRRSVRAALPIDRRSSECRAQDLFGARILCVRFRDDLGPIGRWLARRDLDGLPLLLNVLRGEMALVGPRPETPDAVLRWQSLSPEFARRFSVLPGVTGLAQLSGCSDGGPEGMARRIQYDLYYVDHRSLLLDIRVLFRTVRAVFGRPGGTSGRLRAGVGTPGTRPGDPARLEEEEDVANAASAQNAVKGVDR